MIKDFAEAMTLSGSKVELTLDLGGEISNVVVGQGPVHGAPPRTPTTWVCQICGAREAPSRSSPGPGTSMWATWSPWPLHKSTLPGGKKIEKGKLRGVESNGMLCGLAELGLDTRDFPCGHHPRRPAERLPSSGQNKPSIPADITAGDKGVPARWCAPKYWASIQPDGCFHTCLDLGPPPPAPTPLCANLHEGDLVAYNTKAPHLHPGRPLHAQQAEFPTRSPTVSSSFMRTVNPGTT